MGRSRTRRGIGTYPLAPFLRGRGNGERVCEGLREGGWVSMACSLRPKPSKQLRIQTFKKAMRSPFLVGKGPGDRFHSVLPSPKAIRTAKETTHQKAMRSPSLAGTGVAYNERSE